MKFVVCTTKLVNDLLETGKWTLFFGSTETTAVMEI
jgi:hypothetical protein